MVICDLDTLKTLPPRELSAGLAEVIKYGPIADMAFLDWIEAHMGNELVARDPQALAHAVRRSCEIKAHVVGQDEREAGLRAILNLVIPRRRDRSRHGLRRLAAWLGSGLWHGDGGALSQRLGLIDQAFVDRLQRLIERAGLPVVAPVLDAQDNAGRYLALMRVDKKSEAGEIKFVLIDGPGRAVVRGAPDALVAFR